MKYETTCLHHFMMVENLVVFFQRQQYQSGFLSIAEEGRITWEKKVENGVKSAVVLLVIPFVAKRDMKLLCTLLQKILGKTTTTGMTFISCTVLECRCGVCTYRVLQKISDILYDAILTPFSPTSKAN